MTTVLARAAARLAALCARAGVARLGLAVSGGGDSMALMHVAHRWARDTGGELAVATVDHGLRPEATEEARAVAEAAARLGHPHDTLHWRHAGRGNLQAAAREGRRALLADWARGRGLDAVALGHTRDDVAEGLLMRLARGSGVDGLAAMRAVSDWDGLPVLRPLLAVARDDLRALLRAAGAAWAEDPSNDDPRYQRARTRAALGVLDGLGIDAARLAETAARLDEARDALDWATAQAAERAVRLDRGDLLLDTGALDAFPAEISRRLLARALAWVGQSAYPPRHAALAAARATGGTRTLNGCLLSETAGTLRIAREPAAVAGCRARPGEPWDGRWIVEGPAASGVEVRALGEAVAALDWRTAGLPRTSLMASPAVFHDGRLIAAPLLAPIAVSATTSRDDTPRPRHDYPARLRHDYSARLRHDYSARLRHDVRQVFASRKPH